MTVSDIQPTEALSQVVFVHDYIQLVFHDERFSIYNRASAVCNGVATEQEQPGFADALVSLIGQRVVRAVESPDPLLALTFESGAVVHVFGGAAARGAEAYQFNGSNGVWVVAQNA